MNREWYDDAMRILREVIGDSSVRTRWHQTITGSGPRANLSQQFTLPAREWNIGWNKDHLYVSVNTTERFFKIDPKDPDEAIKKAAAFIEHS